MNTQPYHIYQSILLHAHLPFVRHPEHPEFFEENWLFEAISECYIPLLRMLNQLEDKGIRGKLTLTLTPTLCSMLQDELLINRYSKRLDKIIELAQTESQKNTSDPALRKVREFYYQHLTELKHLFEEDFNRDLIAVFSQLRDRERIEIIGCSATHALLALIDNRQVIRSQLETGINSYIDTFGAHPRGIWMPECAYTPLVSEVMREFGIEYSIVDSHGILHATPMPKYSVFAPVIDENGLILFGRDPESSKQVWSAETGYPGDADYREFYRDFGWDGSQEEVGKYLISPDFRHDLGLKYYKITGKIPLQQKTLYDPEVAWHKASIHAREFVDSRLQQGRRLQDECASSVHLLSPYDAELFGHWWFEGPIFLENVLKFSHNTELELITPGDYVDLNRELQHVAVSTSSWGNNGYFETWLNGSNDWIYQELRDAEESMTSLAERFVQQKPDKATLEALNQAGRELLLAQASDWAFILTTDTTTEYATSRVKEHIANFRRIYTMITTNTIDQELIARLYAKNNIFPHLNFSVFC